jgi:hypothetical protein
MIRRDRLVQHAPANPFRCNKGRNRTHQVEHAMVDIVFSPATLRFLIGWRQPGWSLTTQSQILVEGASGVTATISGDADRFEGNLRLTSFSRVRAPLPPVPAGGRGPLPELTLPGYIWVVNDQSDGSVAIDVEPNGYLEISVAPNIVTDLPITNANNRFTANIAVTGSSAGVDLVLNVVHIASASIKLDNDGFAPGESGETLTWSVVADVWPTDPSDYPINFVLGNPVAGGVVQGQLEMNPELLVITKSAPPPIAPGSGINWFVSQSTVVSAYWFATPTTSGEFNLLQYFFNSALSSPSNTLDYSIT